MAAEPTKSVTIELQGTTLKDALNKLQEASGYIFWYRSDDLNLNKKVSLNVQDKSINDVLDSLLAGDKLDYSIEGKYVTIYKEGQTTDKKAARTLSGVVKDDAGEPLIGASVVIKGANIGGVTNADGVFDLRAPLTGTLEVSYVGYKARNIRFSANSNNIEVVMTEDNTQLNEVVVTALGVKRETKALGYAVAQCC